MRTPKNWSRVSLGHPKFGTRCPLKIWLGCQIYGLCVATLPNSCPNKERRKKTNNRESNHLSIRIVVWGTSPPSSGRLGSPMTKCCLSLGHRTGSGTPWHLMCHSQGKTIPVPHVPQYCQSATEYTCSKKSIIRF